MPAFIAPMRFKGLDLNLLVAFNVLLEECSVSRAAERLHLSQPAMSAALGRLRSYFDDPILAVDRKKMVPTPYAMRLKPMVAEVLAAAGGVISAASLFDPTTSTRRFVLGVSDYLIIVLLHRLLAKLEVTAPNLTFDLIQTSDQINPMMERGEIDLIITPEEHISADHPSELLFEENHVVIGWVDNPLLSKPITMDQFLSAGHVVMEFGRSRPTAFAEKHFARSGVRRRAEIMVPSFSLIPEMLIGSQRIAVLHERLAKAFAERLPIKMIDMPYPFPKLREHIQYHRVRTDDIGLKWFIGQLHEEARSPR